MKKLLLLFVLLIPAIGFSQSYSINWYKIAGGGGTSSNGQYVAAGTIGQPAAGGPLTGGGYSVTGGFWVSYAMQTPGLPILTVTFVRPASVVVSWPDTRNYTLQQNSSLSAPGGWATGTYTTNTANGTNSVTITPPARNLFFRLKQ